MHQEFAYVFVVIGVGKHSRRLEYAHDKLRKLTSHCIYVLTDALRNDIEIECDKIEVDCPKNLDEHSCAIWLKTSAFEHLPKGKLYAYLDTDVISLQHPDSIFDQWAAPISFGLDHSSVDQFSPYGLNCGCLSHKKAQQTIFQGKIDTYANYIESNLPREELIEKQKRLNALLSDQHIFRKWSRWIDFNLAKARYRISNEFYFDKQSNTWCDQYENIIIYHEPNQHIQATSPFTYDRLHDRWLDNELQDIHDIQCGHLRATMEKYYDIHTKGNEPIWNGGVFLFDDESHDFMNQWHILSMQLISQEGWRTRDQATLYITARLNNLEPQSLHMSAGWNTIVANQDDLLALLNSENQPRFVHIMYSLIDDPSEMKEVYSKLCVR